MSLPRALLLALVAVLALAGLGAGIRWGDEGTASRPAAATSPVPSNVRAVAVLRAWDVRRAAAWAAGDEEALRRLYLPGSEAGRRDVRMLRSWAERGLRVHGMRMQVLAVRVRRHGGDRIVLVVADRLAAAVAVGRGLRAVLPRDTVSTRVLTLRLHGGRWRMGPVRAQASPVARTAATSRSSNS